MLQIFRDEFQLTSLRLCCIKTSTQVDYLRVAEKVDSPPQQIVHDGPDMRNYIDSILPRLVNG